MWGLACFCKHFVFFLWVSLDGRAHHRAPTATFLQLSIFGFQLSSTFLGFSVALSGVIIKSMSFKTNKESLQVNDMND